MPPPRKHGDGYRRCATMSDRLSLSNHDPEHSRCPKRKKSRLRPAVATASRRTVSSHEPNSIRLMKPNKPCVWPVVWFLGAVCGGDLPAQSTWTGATGGEWGTPGNWTGGVPNATGAVANINTALTVNLTTPLTNYTFGTLATNIASGSVVIGNTANTTDVLTAAVSAGAPVINVANSNASIFFYANLEGTQGFTKTGSGKLTFRFNGADQAYSGNITISGGVLGINQNGSLGNDNNDIFIADGARLLAEPGSNSGVITLPSSRTITLTGAQSQIGANNAAVNLVVNGTVTEDAAGKGLVKTDPGKVTLAGTIGYTGETRIAAGTLALSGSAALPASQNLRFTGNATTGTLDLGGTSQTVRTIVMDQTNANRTFTGGGGLTVNGDANLQLSASNGVTYDFSGIDSFTFNRSTRQFNVQTVNAASTTTLMDTNLAKSGVNGGLNTITASQILVGGGTSDGNNGNTARLHLGTTNSFNTTTFQVGGFNAGGVVDFQSGLTAPSLKLRAADGTSAMTTWKIGETSSGSRRGEGTVNLTGGTLDALVTNLSIGRHVSNANINDTSSLTMPGGSLSATTIVIAEKTGTGTPVLTSTLTQGGGTVTAGTITLGKDAGGGATSRLLPTYNLNGGTLYATTINTGGGAYAADSSRNLNLAGGTLRNVAGGGLSINGEGTAASSLIHLNVTSASTIHADASQTVALGANTALNGSGNLSKDGSGTLVIGGASSNYTGTLTVSAGTLLVTGQLGAAGSSVSVANDATLGGSGTIGGSLSFAADGKLDFLSTLVVNGATVTFGSGFDMANILGLNSSVANGTYTLISGLADVNLSGVLNVGAENAYNLGAGKSAYFQEGSLQVVVIPEPAAALLGGLGFLALLRRRR